MVAHHVAALAMCLLALAASAHAQCTSGGVAGTYYLDLIEATGVASRNEVARCLNSVKVTTIVGCQVQIEPRSDGLRSSGHVGNLVTAMWKGDTTPTPSAPTTYNRYTECNATIGALTTAALSSADALEEAFNNFIYGALRPLTDNSAVTTVEFRRAGTVLVTFGSGTLTYAITETTIASADYTKVDANFKLVNTCWDSSATNWDLTMASAAADGNCANITSLEGLGTKCGVATTVGRYGIVVGTVGNQLVKICALCPAGMVGDGYVCTPCAGGTTTEGVGKVATSSTDTCTACSAGSYAPAGGGNIGAVTATTIDCLPCPAGTFARTIGNAACTECPSDSYAHIPGARTCVRCISGVPNTCDDSSCTTSTTAVSPGSHILSSTALTAASCELATTDTDVYAVPVVERGCVTTNLRWAFEVEGDCSITIYPIGVPAQDASSAIARDASDTTNDQCTDPARSTYGANVMRAFYHRDVPGTRWQILSILATPTPFAKDGSGDSGYLLGVELESSNQVMTWWGATTKTEAAGTGAQIPPPAKTCKTTLTTLGGAILGGTAVTPCPVGSYLQTNNSLSLTSGTDAQTQYCWKCPVGYSCAGGSADANAPETGKTICTAGTFNPYLGRAPNVPVNPTATACPACSNSAFPTYTTTEWATVAANKTSYEGATTCDVTWLNNCNFDATIKARYFDQATQLCLPCPAGTYRDDASQSCMDCPVGTYSPSGTLQTVQGVTACLPCPEGQYNPSTGLGDQSEVVGGTTAKCLLCPEGSLAKIAAGAPAIGFTVVGTLGALTAGATSCSACPAGSIQTAASAVLADSTCTKCAAYTYRQGDASPENNECKSIPPGYRLSFPGVRTDLLLCENGTISYYTSAGLRIPRGDVTGYQDGREAQCIECTAGVTATGAITSIRAADATNNPDDVDLMPVATWAHTYAPRQGMSQCIPCPAGTYPTIDSAAVTNSTLSAQRTASCTACASGFFRAASRTGVNVCDSCGTGKEVGPSGKVSCTLCRPGFVMATGGTTNFCSACARHNYRATPGGVTCTPCPKGTDTQDTGNTECTACPAGYFNGITGAACDPAPPGTYTNTTGNWYPIPCPRGTWNDDSAMDSCNVCPPGRYASTVGSRSCKVCPAGTFSLARAASCTSCRAGYFAPVGSSSCQPCRAGFYAPQTKSPFCIPCPKGQQCPTSALSLAVNCPAGTFSNREGNKMCTPCPINTYSAGGVVTSCLKCGDNLWTRGLTGQVTCVPIRPQVRRLLGAAA